MHSASIQLKLGSNAIIKAEDTNQAQAMMGSSRTVKSFIRRLR